MELIPPDEKKSISRYEMAERIKLKWGIPSQTNPNGAANGISLERMYVSIRPVLEKLVAEIDRSFEFYRQQFNGSTIEKVYICGGTAKLVNLREYLVSELRLQVEGLETLFDVSCNGDGKIDGVKPELTAAFGVTFEGRGIRSWRFPSIGDFRKKGLLVPLAGVLGIVAAFGMYWNLENRSKVLQMAVEKRRRQVGQLEATMREIVSLRKRRDTLKKELSLYPARLLKQPPYPDLLMEISHLVPGNVSLDFLMLKGEGNAAEGQDIKGYRLEIKGLIFGKGPERIATIAQLMASLEGSSLFENVRLISTKENNEYSEPGDEFELSCLYRGKE